MNKLVLSALLLLGACSTASRPAATTASTAGRGGTATADNNIPDFARRPYEPFSRTNAVAIALREWRAFGSPVDDDPPGTRIIPDASRLDRQPGLWQRVGEYWWLGQEGDRKETRWTGKYDEWGNPYQPGDDGHAWSAAFISYIMRSAGAGDRFHYSPTHAAYINAAARGEDRATAAERPDAYAPQPGDLICTGRGSAARIRFDDLPAPFFPGHCDLVVQAVPGQLTVVGGNVAAGVTMKHVPTTASGALSEPGGRPVDSRYDWFVTLRVQYDAA